MKFNSLYGSKNKSVAEPKCPKVIIQRLFNSVTKKFEDGKKIDIYGGIQSHYESTRLSNKLRLAELGDTTALGVPGGNFIDVSGQSNNYADYIATEQNYKQKFEKLSPEIRALFGNDYQKFIDSVTKNTIGQVLANFSKPGTGSSGTGSPGTDGSGAEPAGS